MVRCFFALAVCLAAATASNASIILADPPGSLDLTQGGFLELTLTYDPTADVNQDPLLAAFFGVTSSDTDVFVIESVAINPLLFTAELGVAFNELAGTAISPITGIFEIGTVTLKGIGPGSGFLTILTDAPYGVEVDSEFNPIVSGYGAPVAVSGVPEPSSFVISLILTSCSVCFPGLREVLGPRQFK